MTNEIIINLTAKDTATGKVVFLTEALKALKIAGDKASNGSAGVQDAQDKLRKSTEKATTALSKLTGSIGRIAFYRAVRDAIRRVTQGVVEGTNNLVMYSAAINSVDASHASESMNKLASVSLYVKDSLAAALMPVLNALIPLLERLAHAFAAVANFANQFFQALGGQTKWTKALEYPVDYAASLDGVGKAAKEAKKQLFGFDELNIFNAPTNSGGGNNNALDYSSLFTEVKTIDPQISSLASVVKPMLDEIEEYISLFPIAIGLALVAHGNIASGIGLLAIGAAKYATESGVVSDKLGNDISTFLSSVEGIIAPYGMAIGAILIATGHPIIGASLLAASVYVGAKATANSEGFSEEVKAHIADIDVAMGALTLGIGAILLATGVKPALGVALIAVGAASMATGVALNWDYMSDNIKTAIEEVGFAVSGAALATGAIIAFTDPAHLPLGIALMALGASGLVAHAAITWDFIGNTISSRLAVITTAVSAAMLAVGAILIAGGVSLTTGFALLAAGAIGIVAATNLDWDNVPNNVKNTIVTITSIVSAASLALGAMLFFGLGNPMGLALMVAGAAGLVAAAKDFDLAGWAEQKLAEITPKVENFIKEFIEKGLSAGKDFVDSIKSGVSEKWESFKSWLSGKKLNINANVNTTGSGSGYTFSGNADGGFVDSGQMFVARENGIPEFVGSWGNQTAVANNQQIVEGIAAGVANAMNNTNSAIYQMANAVVDAIANKEINTTVISDRDIYQSAQRGKTLSGRTVYA